MSLFPELFFQIERGRITVKPMKGTAPRGRTLDEDIAFAETLEKDAKNRAENVMIVDLMRNDLGRICRIGSVETPTLFEVKRYPSLWQMTSTVEGELVEGCSVESLVRALFPPGSVTGAPKIRAMEHIVHLEASARGAYTGAIGYFAPDRAYFNVAIRTATLRGQSGTMGVGGGITLRLNGSGGVGRVSVEGIISDAKPAGIQDSGNDVLGRRVSLFRRSPREDEQIGDLF